VEDTDGPALARLRASLQERARLPPLPSGWRHQSAVVAASGVDYGGDFIIADLSGDAHRLQMVLVDVCGNGRSAVPAALQLAGALQGLIVTVGADELLSAANRFLVRQPSEENIATAVQVEVHLDSGAYRIRSAGHPPALRWRADQRAWEIDNARGTALGVTETAEFGVSSGVLVPGEALLFYTDGVVESRSEDIDTGIEWLRGVARTALEAQWAGAAERVVAEVERGDDDRAVLILGRMPVVTPT
jgi:serine phosphatase RsbU (regulator of sigma subunit)